MSAGDEWNGDAIVREVLDAARQATDETTKDCVPIARGLVHVKEGILRDSIGFIPAEIEGETVVGWFGSIADPGYALPQEFLPEPQGRAFIRPAADREFPKLGDNIAKRLAR